MKIGIIHPSKRFLLSFPSTSRFELISFSISTDELSCLKIFHSAFATPSRYLLEVYRRLALAAGNERTECYFIFSPLLEMGKHEVETVLTKLAAFEECVTPSVLADGQNRPLGYFLPPKFRDEEAHYLTMLSGVNASLDQQLLNGFFFMTGRVEILPGLLNVVVGNQFPVHEDLWRIYEWTARKALHLLQQLQPKRHSSMPPATSSLMTLDSMRALRDAVPFCAIMPHHAGDVLFYSLAARSAGSHIDKVVVNRRYADIVSEILPGYQTEIINPLPPYRDGTLKLQSDEQYFFEYATELQPFSFFYYCRPSRDYNVSNFHLIDHLAFALGESLISKDELLINKTPSPPLHRATVAPLPYRILLHFDAGWGLKIYPKRYQKRLIEALLDEGMEITVLGTEDRDFSGYRSVTFKGLDQLKDLLLTHHMLVGSDSFPSHFAAHVLGVPTICLFGSTKPVNSDARHSAYYLALEGGLDCRPCGQLETCLQTGDNDCLNLVKPQRLLDEIFAMLDAVYSR